MYVELTPTLDTSRQSNLGRFLAVLNPASVAQLAILALDEPTKAELRKKGFDIENIWDSLKKLSPTNILTIRNGPKVVKLWIR